MSHPDPQFEEEQYVSNCCGAEMRGMYLDTEICPQCGEHCEVEQVN